MAWIRRIFEDLGAFLWDVAKHYVFFVTSSIFAAAATFYEHTNEVIPKWLFWTVAGVFLFIAVFLAWRDQYSQVQTAAQRRAIRVALGQFMNAGTTLQVQCEMNREETDQEMFTRYTQWEGAIADYLAQQLDESYRARFRDASGLMLPPHAGATPERARISGLVARGNIRLQGIISEFV